jgi:hypothetical protein
MSGVGDVPARDGAAGAGSGAQPALTAVTPVSVPM